MSSSHVTLAVFLVFHILIAINQSQTFGLTIKLMPIDQVDKSLFPENLTLEEKYERISEISRARVCQLEFATSLSLVERKETIKHEPCTLQPRITSHPIGYFFASMSVGSHSYAPYLIMDTASDDTWIQCEGCTECFEIRQGNFITLESQSYRRLRCNDTRCFPKLCVDDHCVYKNMYIGSEYNKCYSRGTVGLETFSFQDSKGGVKRYPNTVFGCGLQNHGFRWGKTGQSDIIAGILGLGTGPRSIMSQYRNETKMRISYCLPPWSTTTEKSVLLRFGDEAHIRRRVRTTPLLPNVLSWYAINVNGISVAGSRLKIDPMVFRMRPNNKGGFILDSACYQTVLVRSAYNAVSSAVTKYFLDRYKWHPRPPQPQKLDLCYDLPHGNYTFPDMTYHFQGADLYLYKSNVFAFFNGGFCLAIMPTQDGGTNILGSFQQANYRFLLDFEAMMVSFAGEVCG